MFDSCLAVLHLTVDYIDVMEKATHVRSWRYLYQEKFGAHALTIFYLNIMDDSLQTAFHYALFGTKIPLLSIKLMRSWVDSSAICRDWLRWWLRVIRQQAINEVNFYQDSGACLNMKMSYQYRNSHYNDKTASRPSYPCNRNTHTRKDRLYTETVLRTSYGITRPQWVIADNRILYHAWWRIH